MEAKQALCPATKRVSDPRNGIPPQTVRCIRNAGHSGAHIGASKKNDGTIEKEVWS